MYKSLYFGTFPNLSTGIIYAFNAYAKSNGAFSCSFIDTYILYCGVYYMLGFKMILAFWIMFQTHWSVWSHFLVMGNKRWHFLLYIKYSKYMNMGSLYIYAVQSNHEICWRCLLVGYSLMLSTQRLLHGWQRKVLLWW